MCYRDVYLSFINFTFHIYTFNPFYWSSDLRGLTEPIPLEKNKGKERCSKLKNYMKL